MVNKSCFKKFCNPKGCELLPMGTFLKCKCRRCVEGVGNLMWAARMSSECWTTSVLFKKWARPIIFTATLSLSNSWRFFVLDLPYSRLNYNLRGAAVRVWDQMGWPQPLQQTTSSLWLASPTSLLWATCESQGWQQNIALFLLLWS